MINNCFFMLSMYAYFKEVSLFKHFHSLTEHCLWWNLTENMQMPFMVGYASLPHRVQLRKYSNWIFSMCNLQRCFSVKSFHFLTENSLWYILKQACSHLYFIAGFFCLASWGPMEKESCSNNVFSMCAYKGVSLSNSSIHRKKTASRESLQKRAYVCLL